MPFAQPHKSISATKANVFKALLAIVMLSALAGLAGSQLAPNVPLPTVLFYCAIGVAVLFAVLLIAAIAILTFNQFILRHGGTDTIWFWFKSEPPGLVNERKQLKAENK